MSGFSDWYSRNQDEITWFLIGWLAFGMLDNLTTGRYGWALVDAVLIWVNYHFSKVRIR